MCSPQGLSWSSRFLIATLREAGVWRDAQDEELRKSGKNEVRGKKSR